MKRSILFLTNAYPDFKDSYRGVFIKTMAELLKDNGYKVSVVTPKIYRSSHYFEEQNGIRIYRFPYLSGNKLLIEYEKIPYLRMISYYISGCLLTTFIILKHRCRLIHAHWAVPTGVIGVLVGRLFRKSIVITVHGSDFRMAMEGPNLLKKIFLVVCQSAKIIICVSKLQADGIEKMGVRGDRISTIPMGVDKAFLKAGKKRTIAFEKWPITILSNRNLLLIYNVSLLIRAIPRVIKEESRVRFLIAGDGPERENLEKEANNLNITSYVQFLGRVQHDDMPNILAQTDIYISTSLYDGTSVSLLEAMGSGVFPVVTDIPGNREWIIDGKNGFLVPIDKEEFLASRIIDAIRNQTLMEKSRADNLFFIEEKALWPVHIRRVKEIYTNILNS